MVSLSAETAASRRTVVVSVNTYVPVCLALNFQCFFADFIFFGLRQVMSSLQYNP